MEQSLKYISGIYALNIPCNIKTCGDWHSGALNWENAQEICTDEIYGNFGIEYNKYVPQLQGYYNVANHVRACIDLIREGRFSIVQGMKDDYICNDELTSMIFDNVYKLKMAENWDAIFLFMEKEYGLQWIHYMKDKEITKHDI